jgi:hypothetical protein
MPTVNWLAVIVAAISMFAIGGLWYSPLLFERHWLAANRAGPELMTQGNRGMIFGLAFVASLVISANLAFLLGPLPLGPAVGLAIAAGLGFVGMGLAIVALFERRPLTYWLVNGGYMIVSFAVMGAIFGLWK